MTRSERYAFRETSHGILAGQYGTDGTESAAEVVVEPFLNRKGEVDRTIGFEPASLLMAGAWLSRQCGKNPRYSISFQDHWTGAAGQLAAWLPPSTKTQSTLLTPGVFAITRGVSLTGEALNVWLATPPERAASYLQWFSQVSIDVQTALRRWMPYLFLRNEAILADRALRDSLLFYAATRPYCARVRGLFTWDVICADSMASVFRSGSQNMPGVMGRAQQWALAAGRQDLAESFAPSKLRQVMIHVRRDPRALKGLLTLEGRLVEALLTLGGKGNEIGESANAPRNLHRFCGEWSRGVQTKLRRVLGAVTAPRLVELALVEGTASLAKCAGISPERREWTELRATQEAVPDFELPRAA